MREPPHKKTYVKDWPLHLPSALCTDALYHIFRFANPEVVGKFHCRYVHLVEAPCPSAFHTGEVYVSVMVSGIVALADAVFLATGAVVDEMQELGFGKQGQCAENG